MLSKTPENRIYPLDAARAIAAVMGVVLHSALGFIKTPIPQWPRFCKDGSIVFDLLICAIHMVRMPIFFFLAGFFAYQLVAKTNCWIFIKNRFKRIAIPFIIFMAILHLRDVLINLYFPEASVSVTLNKLEAVGSSTSTAPTRTPAATCPSAVFSKPVTIPVPGWRAPGP